MNINQSEPQPHRFRVGRASFLALAGLTTGALLLGKRVPNALSLLAGGTNVDGFQIYTVADFPAFDPQTYQLHVGGMAGKSHSYTYQDLLAMPSTTVTDNFHCVTGWVVPGVRWTGVRLWDLIAAARPASGTSALRFRCMDGVYSESLTFDQAKQPDVLLAYAINGKALSRQQGLPLRLIVPGMYGYKYAKWVNRVEVVDRVYEGYWEQNGYDVNAYIRNA